MPSAAWWGHAEKLSLLRCPGWELTRRVNVGKPVQIRPFGKPTLGDEMDTCFGCKFLTSKYYGDGSTTYLCSKSPGIIVGEQCTCCGSNDNPTPLQGGCYEE